MMPAILGGPPAFPHGPPKGAAAQPDILAAVSDAMGDGSWCRYHGPHVETLEHLLTVRFGVKYALACASGTLAVEVALRTVGVGPGDEVILAGYEYESNFLTIHALGAKPVLIDIAGGNWNLAPDQLEAAISPATRAILASHLHGGIVPMPAVRAIADSRGIALVEDAAQCPGAAIGSTPCGSFGRIGTLSFGGTKLLSAGRGGALLVDDARDWQRARNLLTRGVQQWAPLSELQAAVLVPQLTRLPRDTETRRQAVERLTACPLPGLARFENAEGSSPAYYKVGFCYDPAAFGLSRDLFVKAMRAEGIAFDVGFKALHLGRSPSRFRAVGGLPESTRAGACCVKLHHPVLLEGNTAIEIVARTIENIYRNANEIRAAVPPS